MAADSYWRVKVRWVTPLGLATASRSGLAPNATVLIAAERVVGRILVEPGAGSSGFHVAGELVFQSV